MRAARRGAALLAAVATAVLLVLAAAGRRVDEGAVLLSVSTVGGVLAVGALGVQPWLATRRRARAHTALGVAVLVLVAAHVLALLVLSPDDARYAMSPDGPTRARMAVLSLVLLALVGLLGGLRRRLGWSSPTWRLLHGGFAALAGVLGVGHAVLTDGALDAVAAPVGTVALVLLGGLGLVGAGVARSRPRARTPPSPDVPGPGASAQASTGSGTSSRSGNGKSSSSRSTTPRSPRTATTPSASASSSARPR